MNKRNKPELLAPVGNWNMLNAAIQSGADAIYFGTEYLNMRAAANNFAIEDIPQIVEQCRLSSVDIHLTINSIVFEDELEHLEKIIIAAKNAGVDLVICWDMSVINKCVEHNMPFCISTQASISNSESVKFYERIGASRVVLARECTLEKIKEIRAKSNIEIEAFIHGAMCVAISGRCFMSHEIFGKSANRGECLQPCRREYKIEDTDDKFSFVLGEDYVMSPKDLCTIKIIDQLIEAGIDSFKIEGRKRSPEYIAKVVSTYRKAIDLYFENKLTKEIKDQLYEELRKVYNRGFSDGFYLGQPGEEDFTNAYGNEATTRKVYAGKIINYYQQTKIAHVKLEADSINTGDEIYIIGNTTGFIEIKLGVMMKDNNELSSAQKGEEVTFVCNEKIRPNDKLYKIVNVKS